ncbi:LysR family transcriptional regulator [Sphingomonas sp. RS6]
MQVNQLNIRHLAAMAAVVRLGSISRAADAVHLTQPAVTQGIAKLETQLGLTLFERRAAGMAPTPAALRLLPRVEAALRLIGSNRVTAAQLRAFVALAQQGSYPAAAHAAGVTVSSLHRAVGDLGLALGQRLVDRRGRGLVLTHQGVQVARRLRLALAELRAGAEDLGELLGRTSGRISIGAMPLSRARLLPHAITAFRPAFPGIDILIHEGAHGELVGPLRDGEIDLMIGALRDPETIGPDLVQLRLFDDRPTIFGRAGHPLVEETDRLAALHRFGWIVPPEGTPLRTLWRNLFAAIGGPLPPVPIECGSVITIRELLRTGDELTLLSVDQLAVELGAGMVVDLGPAPGSVTRTIGVTHRADWRPTRAQSGFLATLQAAATKLYT